jgi:soluble lytic murein transglycosylase-like protein
MITGAPTLTSAAADVTARINAIQARIDSLTASFAAPRFDLAALTATTSRVAGGATGAGATGTVTTAGLGAGFAGLPTTSMRASDADWARQLPPAGQAIAGSIEAAAREAGIDPALLAAVVRHESNFDQDVVSHAGAIGLAQLMPGTAEWLGVDPHDPEQNLRGGATYLREQLDRFGSVDLALAAYNAGPNRVVQAGGIPRIEETQIYVERVLDTYQEWT